MAKKVYPSEGQHLGTVCFSEEFLLLREVYVRMERETEARQVLVLLNRGRQVRQDSGKWTKRDLESVVRWRHMHALIPNIERQADIELRLAEAFKVQDEESRTEALCRIPGIGPVLASVLLTLTFPEEYAPLDNHTWKALSSLGFELRNRPSSGGGYRIPELLRYQRLMKSLAKKTGSIPWETAKALYALDQVKTRAKWKLKFDSIKSIELEA